MGQRNLLASMTMNQRSPGKSNPLQTWSVERWGGHHNNAQSCQRQRKISQRSWKIGNCAKEQDNESTDSFPIRGDWWTLSLSMFLYKGLYKEKETSLLTLCMANFGLTATSLFEIWTPAWSSASTSRFHKGICFFSWQNFLFFFCF